MNQLIHVLKRLGPILHSLMYVALIIFLYWWISTHVTATVENINVIKHDFDVNLIVEEVKQLKRDVELLKSNQTLLNNSDFKEPIK